LDPLGCIIENVHPNSGIKKSIGGTLVEHTFLFLGVGQVIS
jgi:hypothetical protein